MARAVLHRQVVEGSADGPVRVAARSAIRTPMAGALRATLYSVAMLLWLSGVLWLVLHYAFAQTGPFGTLPNPWEPTVMRAPGVIAVSGVSLLG
jgi:hypothetical protein